MIRRFSVNFAIFSLIMDVLLISSLLWLMSYFRPDIDQWIDIAFIRDIRRPVKVPISLFIVFPAVWVSIMFFFSIYDGRKNLRVVDELTSLTMSAFLAAVSLAGILYLSYREVSRLLFLSFILVTYLALIGWRIPARVLYRWRKKRLGGLRCVLIIGAGEVGREVAEELGKHPQEIQFAGFLDDSPDKGKQTKGILGTLDDARQIVQQQSIDEVILTLPLRAHERMNQLIWSLFDLPVRVWIVPDYFQWTLHHAGVEDFAGIPMLDVRAPALTDNQRMTKRLFDLVVVFLISILVLPLMGIVALAIWLDDGRPILFRQKRVGENGRLFMVYKFRTMVKNAEQLRPLVEQLDDQGNILHKHREDPRVTRVGRFLRRLSLDELPQFFNVIQGTMSLVGPRPELPYLVEKYKPWQRKRFAVPQGITGWWQIHGRSEKPMHLHTEDDLYYVQNYSIWLDIQILLKTFWIVMRGKGAY